MNKADSAIAKPDITLRRIRQTDLASVVALDTRVTGHAKPEYWNDMYERFASRRADQRFFLVAEGDGKLHGYMAGEVRAWEFGSEPCGWIFGFAVDPDSRLRGIGEALFQGIADEFRRVGITTMRTMVPRSSTLPMAFFRSEGMVAGPYIQLELDLEH
ncbi:MAG: GNAT family N-acetyltransferase [Rhodobacteraceae bacterium]|nr:GNAT family N-acetyltransferase [Paracoccaceae bacterium]